MFCGSGRDGRQAARAPPHRRQALLPHRGDAVLLPLGRLVVPRRRSADRGLRRLVGALPVLARGTGRRAGACAVSDLALFIIGTLVFFLGGTGLVLYGLDTFNAWSSAGTSDDEDRYLDDESVGQALTDPFRRSH